MSKPVKQFSNNASKETNLEKATQLPLVKINFIMMAASAALIVLGFLLMLGGKSSGEVFNPDIFSTRRIVVGPTISLIGFVAMAVSIIWVVKPRRRQD